MKRTTERKWHSWLSGVALTICPSMWRRQRRLWWTSGETPLTTPHWPSTVRLWRESAALNSWGCTSQRISPGPPTPCHSPRRHNSAYTFSAGWKSKSPTTHPQHILQGHHWECADQLHHCLVRELQCCWPQDPPADSEHGCKDHRCPSPIHPGHFPCTMLQQNQQHREGPHPPLPQSLPAPTIRKTVPGASEPAPPDCSTAFSPRLWEPWTQITTAPLWNPMQTPTSWNMDHSPPPPPPPPLSKHPPTLPHQRTKCKLFLCNPSVLHTGEWACTNHL